jgi:hypothetical protein
MPVLMSLAEHERGKTLSLEKIASKRFQRSNGKSSSPMLMKVISLGSNINGIKTN